MAGTQRSIRPELFGIVFDFVKRARFHSVIASDV